MTTDAKDIYRQLVRQQGAATGSTLSGGPLCRRIPTSSCIRPRSTRMQILSAHDRFGSWSCDNALMGGPNN